MNSFVSSTSAFLYRHLVKPFFFQFDPEFVHNTLVSAGALLGELPGGPAVVRAAWGFQSPALQVTRNGIAFPNRVGLSAGFDYNGHLTQILPAVGFGWHTIGTVTLHPYAGNPTPRLGRLPDSRALLVNKGLKNDGALAIIARLALQPLTIPTGISIASTNQHFANEAAQIADILQCFCLFERSRLRHAYYELNISCPNTFGGEPFNNGPKLERLLKALDSVHVRKPIYVKMPIDQSLEISTELLHVIRKHHLAGIIAGNLTKDKTNPAVTPADRMRWQHGKGNLSGKPTWDRSNQLVALARKQLPKEMTVIGTGGIFSPADAAEKIALGADLVQLITGMIFEGPQLIGQINRHLATSLP